MHWNKEEFINLGKCKNEYYYDKNFKPLKLIRVENMEIVKGSDIKERYSCISYVWSQSYEEHTICGINVTFKQLIKEICLYFNVKYLWIDQYCIDQKSQKEKENEIPKMVDIYKNSYFTIVLIPELTFKKWYLDQLLNEDDFLSETEDEKLNPIMKKIVKYPFRNNSTENDMWDIVLDDDNFKNSKWLKRIWTLQELLFSKELVIIGENMSIWKSEYKIEKGTSIFSGIAGLNVKHNYLKLLFKNDYIFSVNDLLININQRDCSVDHDIIFGTYRLFKNLDIKINYQCDFQEIINDFYINITKTDPSILLLVKYIDTEKINYTKRKYKLPRWINENGDYKRKYTIR